MESKNKNTGLVVIIVILLLAVIGLGGYIVYDKVLKDLSNGTVNNDNKTSDNLKDTDRNGQTTKNNNYQLFASNLKNEFSKFSSHNRPYLNVQSMMENGDYVVYLTENQELYIKYYKEELKNKFGDYKITDKVIGYNVVPTGNGGISILYFINEDGTVGSADVDGVSSEITVKKDIGYKNIVSIISCEYGAFGGGVLGPAFIDIDGNIYSDNLKEIEKNDIQVEQTTNSNSYQLFAERLKNEFSKFDSHKRPYLSTKSMIDNGSYEVYLTENQELYIKYFKDDLAAKYGDYKIADKVIGYNVVPTGNGGGKMLYFINEDGTVGSADIEFISSSNIAVKKDLGYKNIVSIVGGIFGLGGGGAYDVIFVDINGRIHSPSEYLFN